MATPPLTVIYRHPPAPLENPSRSGFREALNLCIHVRSAGVSQTKRMDVRIPERAVLSRPRLSANAERPNGGEQMHRKSTKSTGRADPGTTDPLAAKNITAEHPCAEALTSRRFLTVKEAAAYVKVSELTIRRAIREGRLKAYKIGRQIRIDEADLIDFMNRIS
jgi:excisionase family DNA binding protein